MTLEPIPFEGDLERWMVAVRRDLHRHPEIAFQEHRTMERVAGLLRQLDLDPVVGVGGTGVIADLAGEADGPRVALRADTDALPVVERTGLDFASTIDGVMHACGHDGHTAMLLGAAALLVASPPPGPVRFLFQPAEETVEGARAMIADGALEGVDSVFGGHLDRNFATGTLVASEGPVNASVDFFRISVDGVGGHGARPHETVDAIVVATLIASGLQTLVARRRNPVEPAVVTIGRLSGGTAGNVIAASAEIVGTIRTVRPETRAELRRGVEELAVGVGRAHRATVTVEWTGGTAAVVNRAAGVEVARHAANQVVGVASVPPIEFRSMGSEDFGEYLDRVDGCYVRFGCNGGRRSGAAHSPTFDFDEAALMVGARWFEAVARLPRTAG